MKPFLCLLIFLFLFPTACTVAVVGLRGETRTYAPVALASLAQPDGGSEFRIRVEGVLLRLGAPDAVLDGRDYVFPFVDEETAERAVAEGAFRFPETGQPVMALVRRESLPIEAFARPPAGQTEPVAIPFVLEGTRSVEEVEASSRAARLLGWNGTREAVVLEPTRAEVTRTEGIVAAVIGVLLLLIGRRLAGSWRRDRRAAAALRTAKEAMGRPARVPSGRSWSLPWGKIAGVFIVLGIAGARLGKSVAPAADNLARGVVKSADEITSATKGARRGVELPSAGEVALEGLGQASNVKSIVEGVNAATPAAPNSVNRRPSKTFHLTIKTLDSKETYVPLPGLIPATGVVPDLLTFELTKVRTEDEVEGRMSGGAPVSEARTSTDLPDAKRGEFTRIELRRQATGVRFTQVLAIAVEDGYIEVMRATADLEYAGEGSWERLVSGEGHVVLLFTEEGAEEYARTVEPIFALASAESLRGQGLPGMKVTASYTKPPVQDLVFENGKLEVSQRGIAILELRGRNR